MQQMFPGQIGQILEMGGPDMMKTIAPKLVEKSMGGVGSEWDALSQAAQGSPVAMKILEMRNKYKEPKPPTVHTFTEGDKTVEKQWNPETGAWDVVSSGPRYKPPTQGGNKLDEIAAATLIRSLPKLKTSAIDAAANINRIDMMTGLLEQGAGGKIGQIKGKLAPYLESLGMDVGSLSDKQLYEVLAQSLAGSMRMQIVGPGAVSDYEQKLLQKVRCGGNTAIPAAKQLLNFYRQNALLKVNDYNDSIDQVSGVSPGTSKLYKKINIEKPNDPLGIR
jgi:hypothetical protein